LQICVEQAFHLGDDWEYEIASLMKGLVEEGLCMLEMGNSRPASGVEHLLAHYWEMKLTHQNQPAAFHGTKVGLATPIIARLYEKVRSIDQSEALRRLKAAQLPEPEREISHIRQVFGVASDQVISAQQAYLAQTPESYARLKQKIADHWDEIQGFAASVPPAVEIETLLQKVGAPVEPIEIGLTSEDVQDALENAPYLRRHFTVLNLCRMLQIKP
jgi:glycerol-1-phosphate dehydrogenase [NAD(P)+]